MPTLRHSLPAALVLTLCGTAAVAQSFNYRQSGNLVGAMGFTNGANYSAAVNVSPVIGDKGAESYLVSWTVVTFTTPPTPGNPYPEGTWFATIIGVAPASEVKVSTPSGTLSIDLDISKLQTVQVAVGNNCITLPCAPFVPIGVAVKGTFAAYTGIGASNFNRNGSDEEVNVYPGIRISTNFSGNQSSGSATFTGTIGPITVTPPPGAPNGNLTLRKGTLRFTQTPL